MDIMYRDYKDSDKNTLIQFTNGLEEYVKELDPIQRIKNFPGFSKKDVKETLENVKKNNGKLLIAETDNEVIGCIAGVVWNQSEKNKLEIGKHKLGEVLLLFIDEKFRGQGIGTQMLEVIEKFFKEEGCDSIWVNVFVPNELAHNLYKKFGFVDREVGMLKQI